jgi:hypothetical protein
MLSVWITMDPGTAAIIAVIQAAQASGSPSPGGANLMMPDAITCDEPWASDQPAALADQRASFAYHIDLRTAQWWQVVCPLIPKSAAAVGHPPVSSIRHSSSKPAWPA